MPKESLAGDKNASPCVARPDCHRRRREPGNIGNAAAATRPRASGASTVWSKAPPSKSSMSPTRCTCRSRRRARHATAARLIVHLHRRCVGSLMPPARHAPHAVCYADALAANTPCAADPVMPDFKGKPNCSRGHKPWPHGECTAQARAWTHMHRSRMSLYVVLQLAGWFACCRRVPELRAAQRAPAPAEVAPLRHRVVPGQESAHSVLPRRVRACVRR